MDSGAWIREHGPGAVIPYTTTAVAVLQPEDQVAADPTPIHDPARRGTPRAGHVPSPESKQRNDEGSAHTAPLLAWRPHHIHEEG